MSAERNNNAPAAQKLRSALQRAELAALWGMAFGVALMIQPWWGDGLRAGFFVTLLSAIAQNVIGRLPAKP
jgi:hypothetical protein